MKTRGTLTFMRGGRIPDDVIEEREIKMDDLEKVADARGINVQFTPPEGTEQITIVLWNAREGS